MVCFKWKFPQTYNLYETRQNGQDRKRDSIHVQNRVQFLQEITFYNNYIPGIWYRRLKNSREGTPLSIPIRCDAQIKNHKRKQTAKKKKIGKKNLRRETPACVLKGFDDCPHFGSDRDFAERRIGSRGQRRTLLTMQRTKSGWSETAIPRKEDLSGL